MKEDLNKLIGDLKEAKTEEQSKLLKDKINALKALKTISK